VLAEQLSAVSARQVTGVSSQAASISQVVSAVAELHTAADQIDATATLVSEAADSALQSVQRAQALVIQSREAVQRNRAQVHTVIERMTRVDTLTRNITVFTNGIRKLSEETQLLALNATIEAAGAGAIGRRFGVVAGEVESLAQRANEFVDQIRAIVAELQEAGQITLSATQSSSDVADEVEQLADEVRAAQEQVAGAVQRTSELVHQISTATSQQNNATEQMTETMEQIAASADMTNRETRALESVSGELLHSAEMLMSTMTRLRSQTRAS
jgi:methyl-accepting chemotaxis protein